MNIKKIGSGLIVAMSMLAFNAAASDKCDTAITNIKKAAANLRCVDDGLWDPNKPIWQYAAGKGKPTPGDGCDVHQKLARLLYEKPVVKETQGKGKQQDNQSEGRGAARALEDHQYDYAVQLLTEFQNSIDSSVVNPDFGLLDDNVKVCEDLYGNQELPDSYGFCPVGFSKETIVRCPVRLPDGTLPDGTIEQGVCDAAYWAAKAKGFATDMIVAINGDENLYGCRP